MSKAGGAAVRSWVTVLLTLLLPHIGLVERAAADVPPGEELLIQGNVTAGSVNLQREGFTVFGTLRLESRNSSYDSSLTLTSGELTNSSEGLILIRTGTGGSRSINGSIINHGYFEIGRTLLLPRNEARYLNTGLWQILPGTSAQFRGSTPTFELIDGHLDIQGAFDAVDTTFRYLGGQISGRPYLERSRLDLASTGLSPAQFLLTGSGSTILSSIPHDITLWVNGNSRGGHTTLQSMEGLHNSGEIRLESSNSSYNSHLEVIALPFTNAADGVVTINRGSGGGRILALELLNLGRIHGDSSWTLIQQGATHVNRGIIEIPEGITLTLHGNGQAFSQEEGVLQLNGAGDFESITFHYLGGEIVGRPYLVKSTLELGPDANQPAIFRLTGSGSTLVGDIDASKSLWVNGNSRGGHTTLVVNGGLANSGEILFESSNSSYASQLEVTGNPFTNTSEGLLRINRGSGGSRTMSFELINLGQITGDSSWTLNHPNGTHINRGTIEIPEGQTWTIHGNGQTLLQEDGVIQLDGAADFQNITLRYLGGNILGRPYLINSVLEIGSDATAPASFRITGNASGLQGDVLEGHSLWINGNSRGGHTVLTSETDFTNAGNILVQSSNSSYNSGIEVPEGTFTNLENGSVTFDSGTGGLRILRANLLNQGDILVSGSLQLEPAGGTHLNEGSFTIEPGGSLSFNGSTHTFEQAAGEFINQGSMSLVNQTLRVSGGTLQGTVSLLNSSLELSPTVGSGGLFLVGGSDSSVTGHIPHGNEVRIRGYSGGGHGVAHSSGDLINSGTLSFTSQNTSYTSGLIIDSGSLINEPGAVISIQQGTAGLRYIQAPLVNRGTLIIGRSTTIGRDDAGITGDGRIEIESGTVLTVLGPVHLTGGELTGQGTLAAPLSGSGILRPGNPIGTLTIQGAFNQNAAGVIEFDLENTTPGTGHDRIIVNGTATLEGIIRVRLLDDFVPGPGDEFQLLAATTLASTPSTFDLPLLPAGLAWEVDTQSGILLRTVATSPPTNPTVVSGTVQTDLNIPAANLPVLATRQVEDGSTPSYFQTATVTDASGAFTLTLDEGDWILSLGDLTSRSFSPTDPQSIATSGSPLNVHFILEPLDVSNLPDLRITAVTIPETTLLGQSMPVVWTVINQGQSAAIGPWVDSIAWASSPQEANRQLLSQVPFPGILSPGESVTRTNWIVPPQGETGIRHIFVTVNSSGLVDEGPGAANNTTISTSSVELQAPDLAITEFTVPETATWGSPISVSWNVVNTGNAPTASPRTDRVELLSNELPITLLEKTISEHLQPDESQTVEVDIHLPLRLDLLPNSYTLRVVSDSKQNLIEVSRTNNAFESEPVEIALPPLPDLAPESLTGPTRALPGQTAVVHWQVMNRGDVPVDAPWTASIQWLAADAPAGSTGRLLASRLIETPLAPSELLNYQESIRIPANASGIYRIEIIADADSAIVESDESNNVLSTSTPVEVPAQLSWNLPLRQVTEGNPPTLLARLTRTGLLDQPLVVQLASGDPTEATVPPSVTIPSGSATVQVPIGIPLDEIVDGPQTVTLTASAPGYVDAVENLLVLDADRPRLELTLDADTVLEGQSVPANLRRIGLLDEALEVAISADSPQLILPTVLLFEPGIDSLSFAIIAEDNALLETDRSVQLLATAPNHTQAAAELTILDDDNPGLSISIEPATLNESTPGTEIRGVVRRNRLTAQPLRVEVRVDAPERLIVSPLIVIPANADSATLYLSPINDSLANGQQVVQVTAHVLDQDTRLELARSEPFNVTVQDDDGPTLHLTLGARVVREGRDPAFTAVLTRNSSPPSPTIAHLTTSHPDIAGVPPSVTIPAGENSITFPVSTFTDGIPDGDHSILLTAEADDYADANARFTVSDAELADLEVSSVTLPNGNSSWLSGERILISYRVANQGFITANGPWTERVYWSSQPYWTDSAILLAEHVSQDFLQSGQSLDREVPVQLANSTGSGWLVVWINPANAFPEITLQNNRAFTTAPQNLEPAYTATLAASLTSGPVGSPVHFTGTALRPDGSPAANESVRIHLEVRKALRRFDVLTDENGNFEHVFQPLPGEYGRYIAGATHPAVTTFESQVTFQLLGLRVISTAGFRTFIPDTDDSFTIQIENVNDTSISGLAAHITAAEGLEINVDAPVQIGPGEIRSATVTARSLVDRDAAGTFLIRFVSAEGATGELPVPYAVEPPVPKLVLNPRVIDAGMVRGTQTLVSFDVSNIGGIASGPMDLTLPDIPWMKSAHAGPLPSIAPGEQTRITLVLTPDESVPLQLFEGRLAVGNDLQRVGLPFMLRHVSSAVGEVRVTAVNERTFHGDESPELEGVSVTLRDIYTGATLFSALTDAVGTVRFEEIPEGSYNLNVSAPRHDSYIETVQVGPGRVNEFTAFLRSQLIRYSWTVEEVDFEERATVRLETVFETNVPAPVVTIEPNLIELGDTQEDEVSIELTMTNHGLIAAQQTELVFENGDVWSVEVLSANLGVIPPKSSVTVPVVFRRIGSDAGSPPESNPGARRQAQLASTGRVVCTLPKVGVSWELICGPFNVAYFAPVVIVSPGQCQTFASSPSNPRIPTLPPIPSRPHSSRSPGYPPRPIGIQIGLGPVTHTTYEAPNDCSCDKETFVEKCAAKDVGYKAQLTSVAQQALNRVLAPVGWLSVRSFEIGLNGSAKVCTCCTTWEGRDVTGLKIEGNVGGTITATVFAGPQFSLDEPAVVSGSSGTASFFVGAGVELTATGSAKLVAQTECLLLNPSVYVEGSIGLNSPVILKGEGSFSGGGHEYSGSAWGGLTIGAQASFKGYLVGGPGITVEGCLNGISLAAQAEFGGASVSASKELVPKVCTPSSGSGSIVQIVPETPASAVSSDAQAVARLLGYNDPSLLFEDMTGKPYPENTSSPLKSGPDLSSALRQGLESANSNSGVLRDLTFESLIRPSTTPSATELEDLNTALNSISRREDRSASPASNDDPQGVCATVRLQLDQEAVVTRKGIGATLEIVNESTELDLTQIGVSIQITDANGQPANDRFVILDPELSKMEFEIENPDAFVFGSRPMHLSANTTGSARWLIVPRDEAAPEFVTEYHIGGYLTYTAGGVNSVAELVPGPVQVHPNASLSLKYFHQRDVFSDDPFTPEIEPSEPFILALLVENQGNGIARNLSITSGQPQIIENEKGLLIDFQVTRADADGDPIQPSLTVNFGDIGPGQSRVGRWWLESSLQGRFIDYKATLIHEDRFGDLGVSAFEGVSIHELIRQIVVRKSGQPDQPAFLTNEDRTSGPLPDTVHLLDLGTVPVSVVEVGHFNHPVSDQTLEVELETALPSGWVYMRLPDPANGEFHLVEVLGADGRTIPNENAWITDRTFIDLGRRPIRENILHLVDFDGPGRYTLRYAMAPSTLDNTPPISRVDALPNVSTTPIAVSWSGNDDPAGVGLDSYDIHVSENGGVFTRWLTATRASSAFYPALRGSTYAFFSVARDLAGNIEPTPTQPQATTLASGNSAPVWNPIANTSINEGSTLQMTLSATDPDQPSDKLTYELVSGPANMTLNPDSGTLRWPTTEADGPATRTVSVRVSDNGEPPLQANTTFQVTVLEVNHAPTVMIPNAQWQVDERHLLSFRIAAEDPDIPANPLRFTLTGEIPQGATLNAINGDFRWTPSEAQGGLTYTFHVEVTDQATPPLTDTASFTVTVHKVNSHPTLAPIADRIVYEGDIIQFTLESADSDLPIQTLTHFLVEGPESAQIDPSTGLFTWIPTEPEVPFIHNITLQVLDDGEPALSALQTFEIEARALNPGLNIPHRDSAGEVSFRFKGKRNTTYVLEASTDFEEWTDLKEFLAEHDIFTLVDRSSIAHPWRYFRVTPKE